MKNFKPVAIVLLTVMALASTVLFGCSVQPSHVHNYSYTVVKEATCEGTGITYGLCACGESVEKETPAKGHEYPAVSCGELKKCSVCGHVDANEVPHTAVPVEGYPASCKVSGLTEGSYCSDCGKVLTVQEVIPALGHTEVIDEAVAPDCVHSGLTEGKHCSACNEILVQQEVIPATGHTEVVDNGVMADCLNSGLTEGKHCSACNEILVQQEVIPATGHTEVIDNGVLPTCLESGLTEGKHCGVCDETILAQEVIPAKGHTEVIDNAVAPDCENFGLTEGKHCSVCDSILTKQEVIPALGHTEVVDNAVEASCLSIGLTEGSHCSACNVILVKQEVIPALSHTEVIDNAVAPDCENFGLTEGKHCSVCDSILTKQEVIPALGHTEVIDNGYNATCLTAGLTDGKHCSVCEKVLFTQKEIPALGHKQGAVVKENIVEADCLTAGSYESVVYCVICNEQLSRESVAVSALGHTEVIDNGYNATCLTAGLTDGKHCSACGEVLVAQEAIPAKGHSYNQAVVEPTCISEGFTVYLCACGDSYFANYVDKLPHEYNQAVADEKYLKSNATCSAQAKYYYSCVCGVMGEESFAHGETLPHKYSANWSFNQEYHWHNAKCGCDVVSDYAEHSVVDGFCSVCSAPTESTAGVVYDVSTDGTYAEVIDYTGTEAKVKIASEYKGLPVTNIYNNAFENSSITELVLPDTLLTIGYRAFAWCRGLSEVVIPNSVTSIGGGAFYSCSRLTSVVIPDSVTSIGFEAFYYCSSLTSVVIGDSVTSIGDSAFSVCSSLEEITVSANNEAYCSLDGNVYSKDENTLILYAPGKKGEFIIPNHVTSIGDYAFYGCSSLISVIISDSVTSIGCQAFEGCSSLTSVVIGDSVTSIGYSAFSNCYNLTSVAIPDSVTSIGYSAFSSCSSLEFNVHGNGLYLGNENNPYYALIMGSNTAISTLEVHQDAKIIADNAFNFYARLTSVVIGDSVTSIGEIAFTNCSRLTSVVIPDSVTSIGFEAFRGCSSLKEVNYLGTIDQWAEIEFDSNDANPLYYAKQLKINGEVVTEVNLTSATKVSNYAFWCCSSLTLVVIGDSVTSIGYEAFYGCGSLTSVIFEDSTNWYITSGYDNWVNQTGGTIVDLTDESKMLKALKNNTYRYWYKLD